MPEFQPFVSPNEHPPRVHFSRTSARLASSASSLARSRFTSACAPDSPWPPPFPSRCSPSASCAPSAAPPFSKTTSSRPPATPASPSPRASSSPCPRSSFSASISNTRASSSLALIGGWLGVLFMIPLRRQLIVEEHGTLTYPEGTACADVLMAGERGGSSPAASFSASASAASTRSSRTTNLFDAWPGTPEFQPDFGPRTC